VIKVTLLIYNSTTEHSLNMCVWFHWRWRMAATNTLR